MSEKLSLKWNDFQENVSTVFAQLRDNSDFSDVTLACEDGQQFEAHRVILIASSPFFHNLLKLNKHTHPLIYMRGIKSEDLDAIMDFLYCGEAKVFQGNLDSFLAIAEELQVKGLMGQSYDVEEKPKEFNPGSLPMPIKAVVKSDQRKQAGVSTDKHLMKIENSPEEQMPITKYVTGDLQELDKRVKSMMENSPNMIREGKRQKRGKICKVCGKEGLPTNIASHIEANHLDGVALPCNNCEKTFSSRMTKRRHNCM